MLLIANKQIFLFCILILQSNSFTLIALEGTSLKDCKIKFHNEDWRDIDDCDKTDIDQWWEGGDIKSSDLNIDYNLGDKVNVWIKELFSGKY